MPHQNERKVTLAISIRHRFRAAAVRERFPRATPLIPEPNAIQLSQPEFTPPSAYSKPALWTTALTALGVTIGSLVPFNFRATYGRFLSRRIHVYGMWYVTPHDVLHLVSFGQIGFLATLISRRWPVRSSAIAGVLPLGLAIECIRFQAHPGNPFESWDLRNDAVGVCLGAILACAWSAKRRPSDAVSSL
jgi:hypothetical protein